MPITKSFYSCVCYLLVQSSIRWIYQRIRKGFQVVKIGLTMISYINRELSNMTTWIVIKLFPKAVCFPGTVQHKKFCSLPRDVYFINI